MKKNINNNDNLDFINKDVDSEQSLTEYIQELSTLEKQNEYFKNQIAQKYKKTLKKELKETEGKVKIIKRNKFILLLERIRLFFLNILNRFLL